MTKTGPLSYRQLRELNSPDRTPEVERLLEAPSGTRADTYGMGKVSYTQPSDGFDDFGSSTYDSELVGYDELVNRQDVRADRQPWYAKIGAGLAKGTILAGTTFLDGTIGLLVGGAEAISRGDISGLWDNDFSRAMQAVNEWSEEAMPNYYSTDELNSPWYENIFTANFIGDKFTKNLGFSVGALYSGGVTAAGLKLTKLPQLIGAITNSAKAPAAVSTLVGAATSAVNEGRIEALNNSKDWQNLKIQELDDAWRERLNAKYAPDMEALAGEYQAAYKEYEATKGKFQRVGTGDSMGFIDPAAQKYQAKIAVLDAKKAALEGIMKAEWDNRNSNKTYRKVVGKIEEDRLKMGNTDMLLNLPILMASNIVQFTKFYANGFNTARRAGVRTVSDAAEGTARYAGKSFSKGKAALKVTQGALAEGTEEISQKAASLVAGDYYSTDVNNFYKSQIDPDAEQETLSWMKSFASGINETVNDGSSWEEFFIGSLTGLIGVPSFRSMRNADGSLRSPVTLQGGAFNEIKDYMGSIARSEEIANYLNQRVQSPEFLNYYRGMIRHNKYQADMNTAVEEDDEFNFKNAEHAQFVSDIVMFDNAGKLEDLRTYIDSAYDMSDENLQAIVENTTATDEDGKKVGPFVDSNGNPLYATEEGKQQMIEKLTQTRDNMISTLDNYRKTKNDLDIRTGGNLSDEQLSEMTWLKTQVDDWSKRASDMTPLVKKTLIDLSENLETTLASSLGDASMDGVEAIESVGKVANQLGIGADRIQQLRQLALMDNKRLTTILTSPKNEKFVKGLIDDISTFGSDIISALKKQNVVRLLQDLPKIGKGIETYNNKLEEYLADPAKVAASQAEAEESVRQDIQQRKSQDIRANLSAATSLEEFKTALDQEEDKELGNSIVEELAGEGNQVAKNYKETLQYDNELRLALSQLGEIDQTTQDALSLWQEQVNLAENLEQIANPNSVAINNEEAFMEDSGGDVELAGTRFENARYALQRAMSKVNNDIKFKNRFSEEYRKPIDEPVKGKGVDKDSTGDSGTPTVPHVNSGATPIEVPSAPVGNVTAEMVATENSDANRRVETQRTLDQRQQGQRKYYRPAVPELHIEASKEGDFRPFDVVVGERERGVDFSGIYSYLRDNGAFNYVNAAKLKPGDTLGFMIDPEFNDHTIFLVDTRNNQIVGSIDESDTSVARYEGLENLIKKVRDEYQVSRSSIDTKKVVSTNTVTGSNGRVRTSEVHEVSRTTDREGTVIVKLKEVITSDSKKQSLVGREVNTGGLEISLDSDIIDWKRQAAGGRREDGTTVTPEQVTSEEEQEAKEQMEILLENANGKTQPFYASTIYYTKDGRIIARDNRGNFIYLKSDPLSVSSTSSKSTSRFFATPQVRVSKMMVGRIPYISEERSLADIPGVIDGDTKPIFGIIKNGVLTTNEKIDDRLIIKPVDMAQKEGRLYLLIPNAAGTYSPAAVRVKHFNSQEFNLDDATVAATPVGKGINEALDKLADATSQDDVSIAMKELAQDIYMQDVMVTWFDAKAGSGIVVSKKVRKPDGTYEMVTINGQEQIKEEKTTIYFQNSKRTATINGMEVDIEAAKDMGADLSLFGQPRDTADIRKDILNTILRYNLPLQVSVSKINDSGYNNRVIKSNILTSNLREAKVIGSWFTTDYFDNQGNLQRAVSPASVKPTPGRRASSPVGGREGVTQGTRVFISGNPYIVDLKSSIAINEKTGERRAFSAFNSQSLIDMAWAQETFGDATESSVMTENKIITPKGDVLDRNTGHYITGDEAQRIKDKIEGRNRETENRIAQSKRVIADIYENQKKVDKARTDKDYYYILEEDGQYHQYSRVHSRLGNNWLGERTETENSRRALEAGTAVDKVIRDFFTSKETPTRPETLSEGAFIDLITKLTEIKSKMEQMGETFMTNNIVLFQKYTDGSRVAGEVDILSVDKNGNFKIYDVKTSRYSFSDMYFNEKSSIQRMSTKDYYTLQLSAYQNLFESQYGVRPTRLAILPFVLTYDKDKVNSITQEKGIPITYNPAVNVPLASVVHAPQQQGSLPIFDSTIETMITSQEQNRVLPENAFEEGGEIGYYEKDGKLYTGYLKKIGEIEVTYDSGQKDMVPIHVTKVRDRGFGRKGEFGASSEYITVFPNGKAISTKTNDTNDNHAAEVIMKALSAKPEKVLSLSSEKTQIHNPRELEESDAAIRAAQESTPQGGASKSIQKNDSVNQHDDEFEDDLDLDELRIVDDPSKELWDREKELAWLERVLPQLSTSERLKVTEGLIQVAKNGPEAWGRFSDGIIELSDIAAEGTTYHEAFHAVFSLMMTSRERGDILIEARNKWGRKSYSELMELLAEDFREYITSQEDKGLGRKILNFFKNLFAKVKNWGSVRPSLISYYRAINKGEFSKRDIVGPITRNGQTVFNLESALKNNPFAADFIERVIRLGYVLSGSASYSLQGTVYRKVQDNLHDIDLIADRFHTTNPGSVLSRLGYHSLLVNDFKNVRTYVVSKYPIHSTKDELTITTPEGEFTSQQVLDREVPDTMMVDFILEPSEGVKTHRITVGGIDLTIQDAEQIENAKLDMSREKDISDLANYEMGTKKTPITSWSSINSETREALQNKGWTQEEFDRISQAERDQAVECIGL